MSTHVLGGTGLSPTPSSHSSSTSNTTERSFADLGATPTTLTSLARIGVEHPFPIQTLCLPLALAGVDLIGQARTGTGKTLAFGIPIVQADEMLDLGFLPDVESIIAATPQHRQTMLFSATMPKAVVALARRYSKQPTFVHAEPEGELATVPATEQHFFQVHPLNRFEVLCRLLDAPARDRVAVFRRTKRGVERTIQGLVERGYRAGALHGDLPQVVRERVMRSFRKGKLDVLVCTDVAARGLDIAGLSHVINYDTPEDERAYVHRIGRTGRAGAAGVAITFVAWNEAATADLIRQHLGLAGEPIPEVYSTSQMLVDLFDLPTVEEAAAKRAASHPAAAKAKAKAAASASGDEEATQATRTSGSRRRRRRRLAGPRTDASTAAVAG